MIDEYKTVEGISEGYFRDRGSKFISYCYPVYNNIEVKQTVDEIKKKYHDARHHCFAFRIGVEGKQYRANDDGEPSGSAGLPILNQLRSFELTNCIVIVVRYFGGTLLGVPGLINAYKTATIEALKNAKTVKKTVDDIFELKFEYPQMNDVITIIKAENLTEIAHKYEISCQIALSIRKSRTEEFFNRFSKIRDVKIEINPENSQLLH